LAYCTVEKLPSYLYSVGEMKAKVGFIPYADGSFDFNFNLEWIVDAQHQPLISLSTSLHNFEGQGVNKHILNNGLMLIMSPFFSFQKALLIFRKLWPDPGSLLTEFIDHCDKGTAVLRFLMI
jgi:hypothetical protein